MSNRNYLFIILTIVCILFSSVTLTAQKKGMTYIDREDLYRHLSFIAADEMAGRNTPSKELKIVSRYLAVQAAEYGFKPLMPDGSYFQQIPLEITTVSEAKTNVRMSTGYGERVFTFPDAFGVRRQSEANVSGEIVFVGYGVSAPNLGWDDYGDIDLTGKIVVMLDGTLPEDHALQQPENRRIVYGRSLVPREKGAAAIITVISSEREKNFAQNDMVFDNIERGLMINSTRGRESGFQSARIPQIPELEVRHEVAAALLDITKAELDALFDSLRRGEQPANREYPGRRIDITVAVKKRPGHTQNVVAWLEGSDPTLKNEYVAFGSHYDHVGAREGQIWNGADDDGSGTVAMIEIAQAMSVERPKRSVIMVWHTGEEKGLWGSRYFVDNCPVPLEKISAQLQMDMLSRNAPDSIYVIGTHFLSSELDQISIETAGKLSLVGLDTLYNDPNKPRNYFRQSDHYPYYQVGIPTIFYFCGVHNDLHQPTDTVDKCDFHKMERVTKLVYAVGMEIGNRDTLLRLDRNPEVTARGKKEQKN